MEKIDFIIYTLVKISIIIPTYNREGIIDKTLDSIRFQNYKDWECLVVDDHSTDNTRAVVEKYVTDDSRFKYLVNNRKKGAQGARNTGLYASMAEWVFFFDSDNQLQPDCLSELVSCIKSDIDVVQCFSRVLDVVTGEVVKFFTWRDYGNIQKHLFTGESYVDFNHAIIRREKMLEIGGLDEDCPSMQEWDTHLRLSKTARYCTVEKVLVDYYVGAKDAISTDNKKAIKGRLYNLEKFKDDWVKHRTGLYRFTYIYYKLISGNKDPQFKKESLRKLEELVPNLKIVIPIGYIINKWFTLRNLITNKLATI